MVKRLSLDVWRPRLLLLGTVMEMAAMAAGFVMLSDEKLTPQRQVMYKKTERFGGLNTSVSDRTNMDESSFCFYLTFISLHLASQL